MEGRDTSTTIHDILQIQRHDWYSVHEESGNFTFAVNDKVKTLIDTTGASNATVTLHAGSAMIGRRIQVFKGDAGAGNVVLTPNGTDTIDGFSTVTLYSQHEGLEMMAISTGWKVLHVFNRTITQVSVYLGSNQPVTSGGAGEIIEFDTKNYDILTEFDTGTHKFTATYAGKYDIKVQESFGAGTSLSDGDLAQLLIYKNAAYVAITQLYTAVTPAYPRFLSARSEELAIGDTVHALAYHDHGSDVNLIGLNRTTWMTISREYNGGL